MFDWKRPAWNLRLPLFILVSLIGHLFCFYIFQVVYPSSASLPPVTASVAVLNLQSERDRPLLDWAELKDPAALAAPGFRPERVTKLVPRYQPSFADQSPAFIAVTPEPAQHLPAIFENCPSDEVVGLRRARHPGHDAIEDEGVPLLPGGQCRLEMLPGSGQV